MRPGPALFGGGEGGELCCPTRDFLGQDPFPGPRSDSGLPGARCRGDVPAPPLAGLAQLRAGKPSEDNDQKTVLSVFWYWNSASTVCLM